MIRDRAQLASYIALAYVFVVLGGIFLHFLSSGEVYTLKFSLMHPGTWLATIVGGTAAWGLWHRYRWAWWLGLVAALFQLVRMSSWLFQHFNLERLPGFSIALVLILMVSFLVVLIVPGTRTVCSR
jgi:translocator protein